MPIKSEFPPIAIDERPFPDQFIERIWQFASKNPNKPALVCSTFIVLNYGCQILMINFRSMLTIRMTESHFVIFILIFKDWLPFCEVTNLDTRMLRVLYHIIVGSM